MMHHSRPIRISISLLLAMSTLYTHASETPLSLADRVIDVAGKTSDLASQYILSPLVNLSKEYPKISSTVSWIAAYWLYAKLSIAYAKKKYASIRTTLTTLGLTNLDYLQTVNNLDKKTRIATLRNSNQYRELADAIKRSVQRDYVDHYELPYVYYDSHLKSTISTLENARRALSISSYFLSWVPVIEVNPGRNRNVYYGPHFELAWRTPAPLSRRLEPLKLLIEQLKLVEIVLSELPEFKVEKGS